MSFEKLLVCYVWWSETVSSALYIANDFILPWRLTDIILALLKWYTIVWTRTFCNPKRSRLGQTTQFSYHEFPFLSAIIENSNRYGDAKSDLLSVTFKAIYKPILMLLNMHIERLLFSYPVLCYVDAKLCKWL